MVYMILNQEIENMFEVFKNLHIKGIRDKDDPFKIEHISKATKKDIIREIYDDLRFLSLFYNCPLYVYIMSDKFYFSNLKMQFQKWVLFKRISEAQEENLKNGHKYSSNLVIPEKERYFRGNQEKLLEYITLFGDNTNLVKHPIQGFKILNNSLLIYCSDRFDNLISKEE